MAKFMVLYHAPASWENMGEPTPEDMKKGEEAWMKWAELCGPKLVDFGAPLGGALSVTKSGAGKSDGDVTGFSMMEADSIDEITPLLTGHPHLDWAEGCTIEVLQASSMG